MSTTLREIRKAKGVTQLWLAEQLGVHRTTYRKYELGLTTPPKSILFHAAHLLHIPLEELTHAQVHP